MIHQTFLRVGQLASSPKRSGRLPLSANSIWRLVREGNFPKPVKLSAGVTAWRLDDIVAWETQRTKVSYGGLPSERV
jgi:predicted DNA-binding transcriptional regulator AlpA